MDYESKFETPENDALFEAFLALKNKEECYKFFEDLMTIKELQSISQRWQVACLLEDGKRYKEIETTTNASTATISRINKCREYGAGGYRMMLDRLKEK